MIDVIKDMNTGIDKLHEYTVCMQADHWNDSDRDVHVYVMASCRPCMGSEEIHKEEIVSSKERQKTEINRLKRKRNWKIEEKSNKSDVKARSFNAKYRCTGQMLCLTIVLYTTFWV